MKMSVIRSMLNDEDWKKDGSTIGVVQGAFQKRGWLTSFAYSPAVIETVVSGEMVCCGGANPTGLRLTPRGRGILRDWRAWDISMV
jgi:hypothetical protein